MFEISNHSRNIRQALLVGAWYYPTPEKEAASLLEELKELTSTLGVAVAETSLVHIRQPESRFLTGSGKAQELIDRAKELGCDALIVDNELTPSQQRNWETLANMRVMDRQEVILDIFGQRAQTKEARLQVDLARMEYSLPRLTRAWSHFGQQAGGIGGKGEGESQLELDKRLLRGQIERLKRDLMLVKQRRATQRKDRNRAPVPTAAIVGYTNAGKSSLLKRLTGANVLVEDKLFATLDTTTRKIILPNRQPLLLTDTVGFVRKLPHRLVEAFNATLEESLFSTFLIHLIDASQPDVLTFYQTTLDVLSELGAESQPRLTVFNKIDQIENPNHLKQLNTRFPEAIFISVKTGEGIDELLHRLADLMRGDMETVSLIIPQERNDLIARLHREAHIYLTQYKDNQVKLRVCLTKKLLNSSFKNFVK